MVVYREIVRNNDDILHIAKILKEIKTPSEVIIVPLGEPKERDMKDLQIASMAKTWDNSEDEAWDEL
ncbi:MAG: hypothetical protein WC279_04060 [Sulfurimonas sp.]|jgi:MoaA/NifB/PqqE/SkfB family radical SAM enzyme|uniref:hypothetical protein n=1 Tax=unclassified Sulfurimonas TaxID=2623549 RepID=UPI0008B098C3|nr:MULTISPECIES: hypothetical protein [unclassified Sulfurimonas]MDD3856096.1 hypothetical protein [Sulfurimonas sp.]OHE05704.1 MAG: hypothetical protein A2345_00710 [Sulfurimonas sp. RIFOXYB12_FULL_35_9]